MAGNSRLKTAAGGPVYDMGVYCIHAARYPSRAEPYEAFAWNMSLVNAASPGRN